MLNYGCAKIASLEQASPVRAYLDLHSGVLAGVFAEAMLEYEIAADHYRQDVGSGLPLLDTPAQLQEIGCAWTPMLYGSGPDLIPDGEVKSGSAGERHPLGVLSGGAGLCAHRGKWKGAGDPRGDPLHPSLRPAPMVHETA